MVYCQGFVCVQVRGVCVCVRTRACAWVCVCARVPAHGCVCEETQQGVRVCVVVLMDR